MYAKHIRTRFLLCCRWTSGFIIKILKVVKPKFRSGNFQEFYKNATNSFTAKQILCIIMFFKHLSPIAFFYFVYLQKREFSISRWNGIAGLSAVLDVTECWNDVFQCWPEYDVISVLKGISSNIACAFIFKVNDSLSGETRLSLFASLRSAVQLFTNV